MCPFHYMWHWCHKLTLRVSQNGTLVFSYFINSKTKIWLFWLKVNIKEIQKKYECPRLGLSYLTLNGLIGLFQTSYEWSSIMSMVLVDSSDMTWLPNEEVPKTIQSFSWKNQDTTPFNLPKSNRKRLGFFCFLWHVI